MRLKLVFPLFHLDSKVTNIAFYHLLQRSYVFTSYAQNKSQKRCSHWYRPKYTLKKNPASLYCARGNMSGSYSPENSVSEISNGEVESEDPERSHPSTKLTSL
jgi:hypothetical protein